MSLRISIARWAGLSALLALTACEIGTAPEAGNGLQAPPPANLQNQAIAAPPPPEPLLDREALLIAAIRARSAAATGVDDRESQAPLDGRRFSFRIPLGCDLVEGAAADGAARHDPTTRRVALSVAAELTAEHPLAKAIAGDTFEAVEGFWIADPWLLAPHCGPGDAGAAPIGIAQFFTAEDPRGGRRSGRPYEAREDYREGETPAAGDWELVLAGRLRKIGERVFHCQVSADGAPPACIISARFDQVEIVNRRTGARLAEWRAG